MSVITFSSLTFTGTPDAEDLRAAKWRIDVENERLATLDPPGTPLNKTPGGTLKTNYLSLLLRDNCQSAHVSYVTQANESANDGFTPGQVEEIKGNLKDRLEAGEDPAAIVTDTAG